MRFERSHRALPTFLIELSFSVVVKRHTLQPYQQYDTVVAVSQSTHAVPPPLWLTFLLRLVLNASYLVEYTPVVAGKYYPVVNINAQEISTDMGGGVTVTPANASAVWSTFESDLVRIYMTTAVFRLPCVHTIPSQRVVSLTLDFDT